jgi:1,4-alpha-glucan branching enzyme
LLRDLNWLYRSTPALHQRDCDPEGFGWIDAANGNESVLSYMRWAADGQQLAVIVCNFTPVPRQNYRIGVPRPGHYRERVNTDAVDYHGSGIGNFGALEAEPAPMHGQPYSLRLSLPPLATLIFTLER